MRSETISTECPAKRMTCKQADIYQCIGTGSHEESDTIKRNRGKKHRDYVAETGTILRSQKSDQKQKTSNRKADDLSRDDLLFLLSVLEGELQARDEVISVLKAEKIDLALLEAQYGFVTPKRVLEALQRDAIQYNATQWQEDIYEKPICELDKVVEKHKETHKRMLEQLLLVEKSQRETLYDLEDEKKKHTEYMEKSDEFTNLLEQERERLKTLIEQETTYQAKKEKENHKKITKLQDELIKLKSFALLVVDEQQRLTEQLQAQSSKIQELTLTAQKAQDKLAIVEVKAEEEEQKANRLEIELQTQESKFFQEHESMMAKLTSEETQNRQLRLKLAALSRQIDELEETNKTLRKAEDELHDLKEKMNKGECGNSSLMTEVEELRKRLLEMEGKDEELIKMEEQCKDLNKKLEKEASQSKNLKFEVDKLSKRINDLEKLEDAFSKSKQECQSIKSALEKERATSKQLCNELESLKVRIRDMETIEVKLEKTENVLKEDLTKLKTLTVMLVEERKTLTEKIRQTEEKLKSANAHLQQEQSKVTSITEKLIDESKKSLKSKTELQEKLQTVTKENEELKSKLRAEEEKTNDLMSKVTILKKKLQSLELIEKEFLKNKMKPENKQSETLYQENNKIRELTQEVERLKHTLKQMKAMEDDLMKTEDEYESLEKRYYNEQQKVKMFSEELEVVKMELANYKLAEKSGSFQEKMLLNKLKEEEAKSGHLSREVTALKEKIHDYMKTEDTICRLKGDHSVLQRKLTQQENRNKELIKEIENLSKELERYRRFSKSLRPSLNGRRISDFQVFSKEVQTEPTYNEPPDYKSLVPLERAVINGQLYQESDNEDDDTQDEDSPVSFKYNTSNNNSLNNNRKLASPWTKSNQQAQNGKVQLKQNGNYIHPGDMVLTHTPGQPLHIKVTPDHGQNTATLEITSPTTENPHSFTSTAVIPTCGTPKQRITIIQNGSLTPVKSKVIDGYVTPDQVASPFTITSFVRPRSPDSCGSITPDRTMSPIQVLALTSSSSSPERVLSPEPMDVGGTHAVFRVSPDKQAGWQFQRSNSSSSNSSVITTEDNKIHIHLRRPSSPFSPVQEKTHSLTNGMPSKPTNKITNSITITPNATPLSRQSQFTASEDMPCGSAPTRIPKPKPGTVSKLPIKKPMGNAVNGEREGSREKSHFSRPISNPQGAAKR
ncbi:PREDICTED: filamin A-interacting protein 1-like isoform X1 [Nanorana parkeri]|uniref:filamin A-interacting protein 1-like isoform X1 n=2 Tax=Nanorana parkeri TaxID=125878 RepID=UPI000854B763|nr:PREDICTED: filamin A-interacting protein 1-like isoform X1 [Nanorana parkeri]